MADTDVFCRHAGNGPPVICLHSNASVSGQWKALIDRLSDRFSVFAPDAFGAGRSPAWKLDRKLTLADEVELISSVIERAGDRFALVGHSYGAAIALKVAVMMPQRVVAIALYEPTLFSIIDAEGPPPNDADGIRQAVAASAKARKDGDLDAAAAAFIDYWMGAGTWERMPHDRRPAISKSIADVQLWEHALFTEPTPLSAFADIRSPILLMTGARSTASAHGVAQRLLATFRDVSHVEFPEFGHMGPITHPEVINETIDAFLARTLGQIGRG